MITDLKQQFIAFLETDRHLFDCRSDFRIIFIDCLSLIVVTESNASFSLPFVGCSRSGSVEAAVSDGALPFVLFSCCVKQ